MSSRRVCPRCSGSKDFYAEMCRKCRVATGLWPKPNLGKTGSDHTSWKGGQSVDRDGYIRTYKPDHPWPRRGGYVPEHVRLMELHIGRRIRPGEQVHHIDHDKQNNDLSNLRLVSGRAHASYHSRIKMKSVVRDSNGRFAPKGGGRA